MAALLLLATSVLAQNIIDLNGPGWTVDNGVNASVPGTLPSQAHLDLFAAGVIEDPLYGDNDLNQLWVQRSNWTYSKRIEVPNTNASTYLVFDGLDTFTYIQLCNKTVGNTDDQFRQYYFDVTSILQSCSDPILSMNFGSASKIVLEIAKTGDPLLNQANGINGEEFQGKIYARKEQNDFGWDWSPQFAPAGPWKPARIVQVQKAATPSPVYVRNMLIDIFREGQMNNIPPDQSKPFIFNASADFLGALPNGSTMSLVLQKDGAEVINSPLSEVYSNNETITGHTTIDPSKVELWWPNAMGSQPLYNATIVVSQGSTVLASASRTVGFRTIVLNLTPISAQQLALGTAPGSNWHFEINGHEFYAKGSNFVPPDVFWPRVNETRIRRLFESVVFANQNMLRVWSSGAYLPDWVYDMADEMGILLWSEFEFTDAEYPVAANYLANYEAEAYYQVRRVNHHPSLALWAGGNELEAVILAFFFDSPLREQYELIFQKILIKCVYANSRSISYIPSSTYNGYLTLDFDSTQPQIPRYRNRSSPDDIYSNTDTYNYDATQAFNLSAYPIGRFATEFGFHSMPSLQSWEEVYPVESLSMESEPVLHRNRHVPFGVDPGEGGSRGGIDEMTAASKLWYPVPHKQDPVANFSSWTWTTQVFQGEFYASEIAFFRRGSGMRERQLGALYWQLDDLWVAPTWATIEANGRHKVSFYRTKDIFNPVIVHPYFDNTTQKLEVWVTSDQMSPVSGSVNFTWVDWQGNELPIGPPGNATATNSTGGFEIPFNVGAINSTRVLTYDNVSNLFNPQPNRRFSNSSLDASNAILRMTLTASLSGTSSLPTPPQSSNSFTHTAFFTSTSLASAKLQDPDLTLSWGDPSQALFVVTANNAPAAFVWLDHPSELVQGYFEDNGFWLMKGESRTVRFRVWEDRSGGEWVAKVKVRSLWDNLTV